MTDKQKQTNEKYLEREKWEFKNLSGLNKVPTPVHGTQTL